MKIYVINLRRTLRLGRIVCLLLIASLIVSSILFSLGLRIPSRESIVSAASSPDVKTVILDPGHGGEDCGAIGVSGVYEKDLNLTIAKIMADLLKERGYNVVLTREKDELLYSKNEDIKGIRKISDLKNRCKIAEEYPEALFISVHMNSFGSPEYSGLQVYHADGDAKSRALAQSVQSRVRADLQPSNGRPVKSGKGLYILDNCHTTSIIVECGFISNEEECKKLSEKEYQNQLSLAIICGIIEYIEAN